MLELQRIENRTKIAQPSGGKIGTMTLQKFSLGSVLNKHEKTMNILSESERFLSPKTIESMKLYTPNVLLHVLEQVEQIEEGIFKQCFLDMFRPLAAQGST